MDTSTFVLEIGAEELPSGWVEPALQYLAEEFVARMAVARIAHGAVRTLGTARRLVLLVPEVNERQADCQREERGPPKTVCLDADGKPTRSLEAWAASKGVRVEDVEFRPHKKGESAYALANEVGRPTIEVLPDILPTLVLAPRFPKTMRWGTRKIRFARPIRWYLALLGDRVVSFETEGIASGRRTRGHRILGRRDVEVASADEYLRAMGEQHVIVDPAERRSAIARQVEAIAASVGGVAIAREELLDVNLFLVEHPTALLGRFPERYLELPEVVLTTVMRKHQRYFPVADSQGRLMPHFIAIRDGDENGIDTVRRGNEWVLVGRLDDATFFYREDRKRAMAERVPDLARVVFVEGLGTLADKARRLAVLGDAVGEWVGAAAEERSALRRAAELCKVDLTTQMVVEFTELQGVIGGLYAGLDGEPADVAKAIEQHYQPNAVGDALPATTIGCILSLVDKMDHVIGCLSLGLAPKGTGDPQSLRRRTQGMAAIIAERELPANLVALAELAARELGVDSTSVREGFVDLLSQRAHALLDRHGIPLCVREAVLMDWATLDTALVRARLLVELLQALPADFGAAVRAGTRVANIIGKRESERTDVDPALFEHESEAPLLAAIVELEAALATVGPKAFREMIGHFAAVAPAVDALFDGPMVMADDRALRDNRLAMLYRAHRLFTRVADFSRLDVPAQE